ncbi:MAG: MmcQ/YjbR family DNA-binding protein [Actinomycetota bacterium]|nr:MmcQ/YjbR family DNA-binding protein [Actinomycetota bacterium]
MVVKPGRDPLEIVRCACLALPEVSERLSHGAPTFFVRDKKSFVMVWPDGHHQHEFAHLWAAAPAGVQQELVDDEPDRFFRPPYVGGRGWIGMRLDKRIDESEIAGICGEAFCVVAPPPLVRVLRDGMPSR